MVLRNLGLNGFGSIVDVLCLPYWAVLEGE